MERELWSWMTAAARDVDRSTHDTHYHTHSTALIVKVYLWAVLHDRPTAWATDPRAWDPRTRPKVLPSQSTMSRRLRSHAVTAFLERLCRRLAGGPRPGWDLLKIIDGKPLALPPQTTDRDAKPGYALGSPAKGYKIHLVYQGDAMPRRFEVTPLATEEKDVARRLIPTLPGEGYLLADTNYDANDLYDLAHRHSHRLLAPRQHPRTGLGHRRHSPHRRACIATLEAGGRFGPDLMKLRNEIETAFGHLTSFYAGLTHLPPWVRRSHRVQRYVHAKLIVNAARIRANRA